MGCDMIRILLPLAVIAAIYFGPIFTETTEGSRSGVTETDRHGSDMIGNTVNCWIGGNFEIADDCKPAADMPSLETEGMAIFAAVLSSAVAAGLGVIGLLPFIGRLTSIVTALAGVVTVAAVGFVVMSLAQSGNGIGDVGWGSYVAGGGGLLTLIAGLAGIRGN